MKTLSERLSINQRHLRFVLDLFEVVIRSPGWTARMLANQTLQIRAQGTAKLCHGLIQINHEQLDPGFVRLGTEVGGAASVALDKALIISRFCALLQPKQVLEIGTYRGGMTYHIARNSPEDCHIWTLDLAREKLTQLVDRMIGTDVDLAQMDVDFVGEEWRDRCKEGKIEQLWGDSLSFDFAPLGPFELIYVDGSHARPWVDKDTENAFKLLAPTGAILWDDCLWSDVQRTLASYAAERSIYLFEDGHTAGYLQRDGEPVRLE